MKEGITIEVEWKSSPASGVTTIPLSEMGHTKKSWVALDEHDRTEAIKMWQRVNEEPIVPKLIGWDF